MRSRRTVRCALVMTLALVSLGGLAHADPPTGVREVMAAPQRVIPLQTRLRYTTMIVLPEGEEILDAICGDRDYWVINASHNLAYIKPSKAGAATDLDLVTASGTVYSFLLTEANGHDLPDLKVYVRADHDHQATQPAYYSAAQYEALQHDVQDARAAVAAAQQQATERIDQFRAAYPIQLHFDYGMPTYMPPFLVRAIWNDGRFTYIKTDATELPALYELADGKPELVNFQVRNGTYIVPKVIARGYLALGKAHFPFAQQGQ